MSRRTLEFLISKERGESLYRNSPQKILHYGMDIERPMVLRRNEGNKCQNRNSILLFYVDQRKCQAFVRRKNRACIFVSQICTDIKRTE